MLLIQQLFLLYLLFQVSVSATQNHPYSFNNDNTLIPVDTAQLRLRVIYPEEDFNSINDTLSNNPYFNYTYTLNGVSGGCYRCKEEFLLQIVAGAIETEYIDINSRFPYQFTIYQTNGSWFGTRENISFSLGQHGAYTIDIHTSADSSYYLGVTEDAPPEFEYLPLILYFSVLLVIWLSYCITIKLCSHRCERISSIYLAEIDTSNRIKSVDTFRGRSIARMLRAYLE